MTKPKVAFYWCASCGGCEESVVDLAEDILDIINSVDIVFWPVALDFKRKDILAMSDNNLAVSFINGAVRSSEQYDMVKLLRSKSQLVIAFGSCAQLGGIPGLANLFNRKEMLDTIYIKSPIVDNAKKVIPEEINNLPEGVLNLPYLWDTVKTLDQVIEVDYYLPGCPPPVSIVKEAFNAILQGKLPEKGTVLAPDIALCEECIYRESKPEKPVLHDFKRIHKINIEPEKCLLAQGLLCLGPATRKGCGAACPSANMPCTGCMGPTSRVKDYGGKVISLLTSLVAANDEKEINESLNQIVDPVGTFYRYSLPASLIHRYYQSNVIEDQNHEP